jgi:hypothetical protein
VCVCVCVRVCVSGFTGCAGVCSCVLLNAHALSAKVTHAGNLREHRTPALDLWAHEDSVAHPDHAAKTCACAGQNDSIQTHTHTHIRPLRASAYPTARTACAKHVSYNPRSRGGTRRQVRALATQRGCMRWVLALHVATIEQSVFCHAQHAPLCH